MPLNIGRQRNDVQANFVNYVMATVAYGLMILINYLCVDVKTVTFIYVAFTAPSSARFRFAAPPIAQKVPVGDAIASPRAPVCRLFRP